MRAVTISDGRLSVAERPDPVAGPDELLVRVRAAGVNAADLLQATGLYPAPPGAPPDVPGLELAGEVLSAGDRVTSFGAGDRVMAIVGGGAQAELAVVHERVAMAVPDGVAWVAAGGFPEAFVTAHDALVTQAALGIGDRLLVSGAAGGVGTAAVQIGVAVGAEVVASVRNEERRGDVAGLGAHVVAPDAIEASGPYDVVLELVGAVNMPANVRSLATGGRIVVIGVSGGGARGEIDLLTLMQRRGRISASTLRSRPLEAKAAASAAVAHGLVPLLAGGRITVPVSAARELDDVTAAYDLFAAGGKFGKVVLTA